MVMERAIALIVILLLATHVQAAEISYSSCATVSETRPGRDGNDLIYIVRLCGGESLIFICVYVEHRVLRGLHKK